MNKLDKDYQALLTDILEKGTKKSDRTGTGTMSVFGRSIRHKMSDGFPTLTTKKLYWPAIVSELIWFLRGDTNIQWLVQQNNNIWVGDCYKRYNNYHDNHPKIYHNRFKVLDREQFIEEIKNNDDFANEWGDIGPGYGKQWRRWTVDNPRLFDGLPSILGWETWYEDGELKTDRTYIDQIQNVIDTLIKNPDSRRIMVNAWRVDEVGQTVLPPCHYGFQFWTRELSDTERFTWYQKQNLDLVIYHDHMVQEMDEANVPKRMVSLLWNQRSVDTFLGLPFNIASYGLLLHIIALKVNMVPGEILGNLGDTHIYLNHIDQVNEQLGNEPYKLPELVMSESAVNIINNNNTVDDMMRRLLPSDFSLKNYQSHKTIKAPLSN